VKSSLYTQQLLRGHLHAGASRQSEHRNGLVEANQWVKQMNTGVGTLRDEARRRKRNLHCIHSVIDEYLRHVTVEAGGLKMHDTME